MYELAVEPPFCSILTDPHTGENLSNDCGNVAVSVIFHVTFQLATMFMAVNFILAIIINEFGWVLALVPKLSKDEAANMASTMTPILPEHVKKFRLIWDRFDPYSSGQVNVSNLPSVVTGDRAMRDSRVICDGYSQSF